jgi:ADP-heptose:LPS heptosyltransferase
VKTETILDLARVIAGAGVFIGNQSAPMAIALGLGKNVIQECWQANPNCLFRRDNAIYFGVTTTDRELEIPKEWLTE